MWEHSSPHHFPFFLPMFAILPLSSDFVKDDAEFFGDLEAAYEFSFNWSAELYGTEVGIFEFYEGKYTPVTKVFA